MSEDAELEVLLSLDGASWEAAEGYMVEFRVHRTQKTVQRPHGINYTLVFRLAGGEPFVRFDNAHAAKRPGGRFVRLTKTHDHWHRGEHDPGRPYNTKSLKVLPMGPLPRSDRHDEPRAFN